MTMVPGEVTIADLYRSLESISKDIGSMAADLRVMTSNVEGHSAHIADHESRIRALEASRQAAAGALTGARLVVAGLVVASGAAAGWLTAVLTARGH
jgi:hypothetical protein